MQITVQSGAFVHTFRVDGSQRVHELTEAARAHFSIPETPLNRDFSLWFMGQELPPSSTLDEVIPDPEAATVALVRNATRRIPRMG